MTREEMMTNLQEHQYSGGGSFGLNAMYFAFGNPITDSMVVNAYAKTNKAAFQMALNTGVYGNHTFMGGNFLYNTLNNNKYTGKLFKNAKTVSVQPFSKIKGLNKIQSLRNFSFNFISSNDIDNTIGKGVAEIAEKTGLNKTSEIVRTGWGFGRNYSGFFKALSDTGYNANNFSTHSIASASDTRRKIATVIKNMDDETYKKFASTLDKRQLKNLNKIRIGKKAAANDAIINSIGKFSGSELTALNFNSANLSGDLIKNFIDVSDDKILKLADEFINIGGKLSNYSPGMKVATKELREELAGAIGKRFALRTTFEKIISNPFVRIATGAAIALPASVSVPLMIATTGIGMTASIGQENAVNNFINSHLYNTNQYDQYSSAEATSSIYSAANIRNVNLQALANSYQNINVANRYLNDMDPISSDYSYKLDDAETM